jgi:CRP-like cAMP-binding protein
MNSSFGRNRLLDELPGGEREAFAARTRDVELRAGQLLLSPSQRISRIYFPTSTYLSVQVAGPGAGAEVMVAGFEGAVGAQLALGAGAHPLNALVQADGRALAIDAADFARQLQRSDALYSVMQAYVGAMIQKIAISCGCLQHHALDARLARRLLVTHDCARRADFHVTHEFLASVLGVRRVGVTNAATRLHRRGVINYTRGQVSVLDRRALEASSCDCYAATRRVYALAMRRSRAS